MTLQKIIPFYLISILHIEKFILIIIIILCSIIPPYILFKWNNFKIIISYSSINQSRWIILLIYFKNIIWLKYFSFYRIIILILFSLLYLFKVSKNFNNLPYKLNFILLIFIFNLAGLPPFSFFFLKWFRIFISIYNNFFLNILILIILRSFIILYIYINIIIKLIFIYNFKTKLLNFNLNNFNINFFILLIIRFFLSLIIIII